MILTLVNESYHQVSLLDADCSGALNDAVQHLNIVAGRVGAVPATLSDLLLNVSKLESAQRRLSVRLGEHSKQMGLRVPTALSVDLRGVHGQQAVVNVPGRSALQWHLDEGFGELSALRPVGLSGVVAVQTYPGQDAVWLALLMAHFGIIVKGDVGVSFLDEGVNEIEFVFGFDLLFDFEHIIL